MRNLLSETEETIKGYGKKIEDIKWVGSKCGKYVISWEDFEKIANIDYDGSYGAQEIAEDLVVVGDNWWMERAEYDGSEWWEFKSTPIKKEETLSFNSVGGSGCMWKDIKTLNEIKEADNDR